MSEQTVHELKRRSLLLSLFFVLATLAHMLKDILMARAFGTGPAIAAFELVFVLPNLTASFFAGGLAGAVIPRAAALLGAGGRPTLALWRYFARLSLGLGAIVASVIALGLFLAEPWLRLLAFGADAQFQQLAVQLWRLLLPTLLISLAIGLATSMLHSIQRFLWAAVAACAAPLLAASLIQLLAPTRGIHAALYGFVFGQLLALAIVGVALWTQAKPQSVGPASSLPLRESLNAILMVLVGWSAATLNVQVDLSMATSLGEGSVPALRFASKLFWLPVMLFASSVGVSLLPSLSAALARADGEAVQRALRFACRVAMLLLLPSAIGLALIALPLVRVLFERGEFTPADSERTAAALRLYAPATLFYGFFNVFLSLLHARRRQRAGALVALALVPVNLLANWLLMQSFGHLGIAAATSIVALLQVAILAALVPESPLLLRQRTLWASWARAVLASAVMAAGVWALGGRLAGAAPATLLMAQVGCGAILYLLAVAALRGGELRELRRAFRPG